MIAVNLRIVGQTAEITDSTIIVGMVKNDCYVSKNIGSTCSVGYDRKLEPKSIVFVRGAKACQNSYSSEDFFEIIFKKNIYFIEKDNLVISKDFSYSDLVSLSEEQKLSFANHSDEIAELHRLETIKKALDFLEKSKSAGIVVFDWSFYDESEYTEGTSVKIQVYNPTVKTIKYLWFNFIGYNAVDDKVIQKGVSTITKKAIGPIESDETGTYQFEYVWFTDIVEKMKIASIKVQYMDGSIKTVTNTESITLSKEHKDALSD